MLKTLVLRVFVLAALTPFASCADSLVRAEKDDVEMLLSAASGAQSAYWASYIGETRERVYIEYVTVIHASSFASKAPKHTVYWLAPSELTEEELGRFKAYKDKWGKRQ
jgi:hypothetical protein